MSPQESHRTWAIVLFCLFSGLVYGLSAAALAFLQPTAIDIGGMTGAILGAVSCLFLMPDLRETRLSRSLPLVFVSTLAASLASARFLYLFAGGFAFAVQLAATSLAHRIFYDPPNPFACTKCGYDLQGLQTGPCPECGEPFV